MIRRLFTVQILSPECVFWGYNEYNDQSQAHSNQVGQTFKTFIYDSCLYDAGFLVYTDHGLRLMCDHLYHLFMYF